MKRILLGAAVAAGLSFGVPAWAQTYQDFWRNLRPRRRADPTWRRAAVHKHESGQDFWHFTANAYRLSADACLCAALCRSDIVARSASERNGRHRLQYGRERSLCDAWQLDRHRDSGQRRHPGRRLDGIHRWPERISCRN